MAGRLRKKGIDFAGWDVNIFDNDTKIDQLLDAQGWLGFSVYFYLCQKAYASEGYYYSWSYANAATTARKMGGGIKSETVKQTVAVCLQIGLFDKRLFDMGNVLTSRGIQRRFAKAIQSRDIKTVDMAYWLLDEEETRSYGILPENANFPEGNGYFLEGNAKFPEGNAHNSKVKESKVKDSRVKKGRGAPRRTSASQMIEAMGFSQDLEQAVKEWVKFKTEKHEGYKETGLKMLLSQIAGRAAESGDKAIIDMIHDAMANNWKGIHLERLYEAPKTTRGEQIRNRVKEVDSWV